MSKLALPDEDPSQDDVPGDLERMAFLVKLCWRSLDNRHRGYLLAGLGIVLATAYGVTLAPLLFAYFVDNLRLDGSLAAGAGAMMAAFLLAYWLSHLGRELLWITAGPIQQRVQRHANAAFFAQAMALPFDYHVKKSTGGLNEKLMQAQNGLNQIVFTFLVELLPTIAQTFFIIINSIIFLPHYVTPVLIATVVIYLTALMVGAERIRQHQRAAQRELISARGLLTDAFMGIEAVKAFGQEAQVADRYDARLGNAESRFHRFLFVRFWLGAAQITIATIGMATALGLGVMQFAAGDLTIGALVLIQMYFVQTITPLQSLSLQYRNVKTGLTLLDGVLGLFGRVLPVPQDEEDTSRGHLPETRNTGIDGSGSGLVRLSHVSVWRHGRTLLDDVSIAIDSGEIVALVGPTGAGKSTVVRLLLRLIAPDSGSVCLDGKASDAIPIDEWRSRIALVPQDIVLFNDTLAANLRFGAPAASDAALEKAVKMCRLNGLLERAPDGLQTHVGERGQLLSGGERQRIGVARAILRQPDVIVLDEATSALDRTTEREVLTDLQELAPDIAKAIVTHRLEAVKDADRIYVLRDGRIVETGDHVDLFNDRGLYRSLVDGEHYWDESPQSGTTKS